jgi:ACDE family multidrug resistance protein
MVPMMPVVASLIAPAVLMGFAMATTIPVVLTLLAGLAPDDSRGAFMSLNGTVLRLGQTLGPVIMTAVYSVGGFAAVYVVGSGLALAFAGLASILARGFSESHRG